MRSKSIVTFISRIDAWRATHVSERMFVLMLAFLVGLLSAVAAFLLHWLINQIVAILTGGFDATSFNLLYLVYPVVGILVTMLFVRYVVKDNISHGITRILYAISQNRSRLKVHNTWTSVVASAITIGFGGSVGAEAPIVLTGSAIGSNLGKLFRMDSHTMMLLVGCGAAGAIAGIFKAPIAGLVFTLEVLMIDLTMASLMPILISCVTATCFTYIFSGDASLFSFHLDDGWTVERIPACVLLGVFCGIVSLYFVRTMGMCENMFARLQKHSYLKLVVGGLMLSLLIFLFPSLFGEGYASINLLLNGNGQEDWSQILNNSLFAGHENLLVLYVFLVLLTKVFATSATNGAGGCGGTFAPSLFVGCFSGFFFSRMWNMYEIGVHVPEKNFALMGMAGVMSGVMHAPLTGIFLIAELTGGYSLFLPLMIVSVCSYLTINIFEPHSIYGARLAKEGKLITHHTDHAVLTLMQLDSVIDRDFTAVSSDTELADIVRKISRSKWNIVPVLDAAGRLQGEIDIKSIRHIVFRTELYHHFTAQQLMQEPSAILTDSLPMKVVMKTFDDTRADYLPVLDSDGHLKGYLSRDHVFTQYRKMVADMSED